MDFKLTNFVASLVFRVICSKSMCLVGLCCAGPGQATRICKHCLDGLDTEVKIQKNIGGKACEKKKTIWNLDPESGEH